MFRYLDKCFDVFIWHLWQGLAVHHASIFFLLIIQLTMFLRHVFLVKYGMSLGYGYGRWNGSGSDVILPNLTHNHTFYQILHVLSVPMVALEARVLKLVEPQAGKLLEPWVITNQNPAFESSCGRNKLLD